MPDCPVLVDCARLAVVHVGPALGLSTASAAARCCRRWLVLLGVENAATRAQRLNDGYGEALASGMAMGELACRVARVAAAAKALEPERHYGLLRLDLMAREGFVGAQAMGLHPREFALLWRLMDCPGEVVEKQVLLREVWHQHHMPETNSIVVHASRLRAKLALVGQGGLLQTAPGGYYLGGVGVEPRPRPLSTAATGGNDVIRLHRHARTR